MLIVKTLLEVQTIELGERRLTPEREELAGKLRAQIPSGVLEKFDRWVGRRKRAVAIVRNGVCGECHLRLPSGTVASLAYTTEFHFCNNCFRILYLAQDEATGPATTPATPAKGTPKKAAR